MTRRRHHDRLGGTPWRVAAVVIVFATPIVSAQEPARGSAAADGVNWRPLGTRRDPAPIKNVPPIPVSKPVIVPAAKVSPSPTAEPPVAPPGVPLAPPAQLPDIPPETPLDAQLLPEMVPPLGPHPDAVSAHPRAESRLMALARAVHDCLAYPDPCYEPRFVPAANAAFFVEPFRPASGFRIGYEAVRDFRLPDRAEFFWARADGNGKGPGPLNSRVVPTLGYDRLMLTTEAAAGKASVIFKMPYQAVDPVFGQFASGFGDITIGAKSVLFDCELLQIGFLFNTILPAGNFRRGLGVGHVSLEPSLLFALKLSNDAYIQAQVSEWVPLGGDSQYQGSILHSHLALNVVCARIAPDAPVVATLEVNTYSFQGGAFTDPVLGTQRASGRTFVSLGPGLRTYVTNKFDIGFGASFALTGFAFPQQVYLTELRFRF